ncbi:MAG: response regulator transcription factor [Devosiaceae bacterium]|nr:response regulator transcription factor [Devosiaceae bacterium]
MLPEPNSFKNQKILIAEDDDNIRNLLGSYLSVSGFEITAVATGSAALKKLQRVKFDMAVLDIMMPDNNGLDICATIREHHNMPVLLLTALGEERDRIRGFEMGADDYLVKPFSPRELVARVKAILRRSQPNITDTSLPHTQNASRNYPIKMNWECKNASFDGHDLALTHHEFTILSALTRRPGIVFSRDELLDLLYPSGGSVVQKAVDVHIHNLRNKLGGEGAKLVQTVRGFGYRAAKVDVDNE